MAIGALGGSANRILINIVGDRSKLTKELEKSENELDKFNASIRKNAPLIGAAFAAAAIGLAGFSVAAAMKYEQLERGFHSMAEAQGKDAEKYLKKIKEVSHGTVAEAEIMQKANQAMLLGIDLETIVHMMEGAAIIAQATGQDVGYMFESLALGVGRQSRMLLDNLGIIVKVEEAQLNYANSIGVAVSELDDEQKKTAFLNATMEGLAERTDALGGFTDDTKVKWAQLNAKFHDTTVLIGEDLLPEFNKILDVLNELADEGGIQAVVVGMHALGITAYTTGAALATVGDALLAVIIAATTADVERTQFWLKEMERNAVIARKGIINLAGDFRTLDDLYRGISIDVGVDAERDMITACHGVNNALGDQLDIQNQINDAVKTELTMRERAKAALIETQRAQTSGGRFGGDESGLSATMDQYAAGESYTRPSGAWTISGGNNSGV